MRPLVRGEDSSHGEQEEERPIIIRYNKEDMLTGGVDTNIPKHRQSYTIQPLHYNNTSTANHNLGSCRVVGTVYNFRNI